MKRSRLKKALPLIAFIVCVSFGGALTAFLLLEKETLPNDLTVGEQATSTVLQVEPTPVQSVTKVIGTSVEGRVIEAVTYGTGATHILFVGGIHGGYEWNTVLLAYTLIDYLQKNPGFVPQGVRVTVIPSLNPDGVYKVTGKEGRFSATDVSNSTTPEGLGRFNANNVDLNRNFACKWKSESTWRDQVVSAGTQAFSEPEAQALESFVAETRPTAVVFWHSKSNAVYASECENGILPETRTLMSMYAEATGYPAFDSFDSYEITGDAEGWLASLGIPAITVELKTHEAIEWDRNYLGIQTLLSHYAN